MEKNFNQLKKYIEYNGLDECTFDISQLKKYVQLFIEWNERINLSAHTEEDDIFLKDIIDTMYCVEYIQRQINDCKTIADFGCGAGFLGVILSLLDECSKKSTFLFDKSRKKINFVKEVIRTLNLKNAKGIQAKITKITNSLEQSFDLIVSRATWSLEEYIEYARPYLNPNGIIIYMGGRKEFNLAKISGINHQMSQSFDYEIRPNGYKRTIYQIILKS